jgi:hypothetical protein
MNAMAMKCTNIGLPYNTALKRVPYSQFGTETTASCCSLMPKSTIKDLMFYVYGQMRQFDPLGLPPRTDQTEMTHYLRPPFPQIPPDDLLAIIETATQWHPMPGPPDNAPPQPEPEQLVHEPPTTDALTPTPDE